MLNVFRPFSGVLYSSIEGDSIPHYTIESLTRDVNIKPLHSHNDYWRKRPFFDALSHGCQSIESDVWKFTQDYQMETSVQSSTFSGNEVYVGHSQIFLKDNETLNSLYLDPIYDLLLMSNPDIKPKSQDLADLNGESQPHGIFYNSPESTLYFWMDFKTEASELYQAIKPLLMPFVEKDYLSYYDKSSNTFIEKPVTVTISGNLPMEDITRDLQQDSTQVPKIYTFIDAPLHEFGSLPDEKLQEYAKISRVASSSMEKLLGHSDFKTNELSDADLDALKKVFDKAHSFGLKTRIWGGISWPQELVYNHNINLFKLGCDLINTDDLDFGSMVSP